MINREENIDLVFRNGLKDYEVLPPPEVWGNVHQALRKIQRPVIIFRVAAMIAVILSLGLLTYKFSTNISSDVGKYSYTFNPQSGKQGSVTPDLALLKPKYVPQKNKVRNDYNSVELKNANLIASAESDQISGDVISLSANNIEESKKKSLTEKNNFISSVMTPAGQLNTGFYSQSVAPDLPAKNQNTRWTIEALISPTYYSDFNSGNSALGNMLISDEQPVLSYTGGLAFGYKINKRFSVQSGLYYSSLGNELTGISSFTGFQKYDYTKSDHNFELLTKNGTVYTDNSDVYLLDNLSSERLKTIYTHDVFDPAKADLQYLDNSLMQNFSYLELPVIVKYKLIDRTIGFNIIGGVSSNFLINNAVYANLNGVKYQVAKTEGVNPISFSSSLGMGMEYNVSKNLSLNLEPTFRYYINPFSEIHGLNLHPYSFGIFSGLSYKF